MGPGTAVIVVRNDLSELVRLAAELEAFARRHALAPRTLFDLNLVIEEVVTNIISYGYDDGREHVIRIELRCDGDTVAVRIEDDGRPFDPTAIGVPDVSAPLDERGVGGVGMMLVRTLMDTVRYTRQHDSNVLLVTKGLGGHAEEPGAHRPGKEG